jgi:hypothetical protein
MLQRSVLHKSHVFARRFTVWHWIIFPTDIIHPRLWVNILLYMLLLRIVGTPSWLHNRLLLSLRGALIMVIFFLTLRVHFNCENVFLGIMSILWLLITELMVLNAWSKRQLRFFMWGNGVIYYLSLQFLLHYCRLGQICAVRACFLLARW